MEWPPYRMWMCQRKDNKLRDEFIAGVEQFDAFARSQNEYIINGVYHCPCTKCQKPKYLKPNDVKLHLYKKGSVQGYWT